MPYMTPDLSSFFNQDPELMGQMVQSPQPANPEQMLQQLLARSMGRGLSVDPVQQRPMYSGPVAGYDGPTRGSDIPGARVAQVQPARVSDQQDLMRGIKIPGATGPVANLEQLIPLLHSLKGVGGDTQFDLLNKLGLGGAPGATPPSVRNKMDLQTHAYNLGAGDRQTNQDLARARITEAQTRLTEMQNQFDAKNKVPYKDATKAIADAANKGATPEQLAEMIKGLGYTQAGTTTGKGWLGTSIGAPDVPVLGAPDVQRGKPAAPAATPGQTPAAGQPKQQAKVVVEKGGKKFTLDVGELEQAQKEGYKLVR